MPNKIKYTTTPTTNTIKVGNFVLGVVTGATYGSTLDTSFYNGYDVPSGGYVVYQNKLTLGPSVFAPTGNTQMVNLTNSLGNVTATTIYDSLKWINDQNTIIAVNKNYENIVTSGLTMLFDAGFTPSYPLSGTSWSDLSFSGKNGTLINGTTYSSVDGGSIVFDGTNDYVSTPNVLGGFTNYSAEFWFKLTTNTVGVEKWLGNQYSGVGRTTFDIFTNNKLRNFINDTSISGNTTIYIDTWYQAAFTRNSTGGAAIYLNGTLDGSGTISTISVETRDFQIGGSTVLTNRWLNGNISIVRLYNRELSGSEILQNYNAQKSRYSPFDSNAQAFITAAGITDPTQQFAINNLVSGLKVDGIWNKFTAIYPFVGGTANSHKWNLRDPRDLNAAYRLVFNGGWVHTSQGIQGNGVNTYADTNYTGGLGMMGFYTSSNNALAYGYYQAQESCGDEGCYMNPQQRGYLASGGAQFTCCYWPYNSPGFYGEGLGQIGNTSGYKNGRKISDAHGGFGVINLPLGAIRDLGYNEGGSIAYDYISSYTSGIQSFSYFSTTELTGVESANLYTRVQAFQTDLGRQVANLPVSDPDAFRYLNNGGIRNPETSLIQMNALDNLAIGLKVANIWNKMRDIIPFLTDTRNIFSYSEQFTNSYWNKANVTISANTTTSPNNTLAASSFIETTSFSNHILYVPSGLTLSPEKYTTSIYLKKSSRDWAYISMFNVVTSDTFYGYFNLATGTIGTVTSGATATMIDSGNGWYRCTLTRTMSTYNGSDTCTIGSASADNTPNYTGNGTTAMFIWGAQLEFGLTATTYQNISTTSSQRTQSQFLFGNLKDPGNGFNGGFNGGWTFSRTGAKGNGINGWVQLSRTFYNTYTSGNLHVSAYSRAGVIPDRLMSLWGSSLPFSPYNGTVQATFMNVAEQYSSPYSMQMSLGSLNVATLQMSNARGLIMTSATNLGSNGVKTYQNGVLKRSDFAGTGLPGLIVFNAYTDNSSFSRYAPFEIAFITTGLGLTPTEAADFNTVVTNYQTALSRQIDTTIPAPVNTAAPTLSGTPLVGQTLTSSTGTWTSATTPNFYYRWYRNGGDIGITTSTYVLTSSDFNTNITCRVTAISVDGASSAVTSNSLLINQAATNTSSPFISGLQTVSSTLSSTTGSWAGNSPITFGYQWKKNGSNIVGATSSTYVLVIGDLGTGTTIQCVVTGTNSYGSSNANSNILTGIASANPINTVSPVISGTQTVGQTLTTTNGTWTGAATIVFTYQWKRNGSNIVGATSQTYLLVSADQGVSTTIQCAVTGTNSFSSSTANSNTFTGIGVVPTVSDANAQAFLNAAGISNATQANAINNLVIGLKADGNWTGMRAIYPFVGGNASTHKYNLKDPRDLPAAYALQFNGGITHSSNGVLPNGTNGYAETYFSPTLLSNSSIHYSGYFRTLPNYYSYDMGCELYEGSNEDGYPLTFHSLTRINYFFNSPPIYYASFSNGGTGGGFATTTPNNLGNFIITRTNDSTFDAFKGSTLLQSVSSPSYNAYITMRLMSVNLLFTGGESFPRFGESQMAFATIGEGLTNTQTLNLNTRIETFQTVLSRSVNPPVNTVAPVISGTQEVGQTLSATNGTWTGAETITFTYQWKKNGSNIGGATSQTYLLVAGDLGASTTIQCVVTGTNALGNSIANSNILTGVSGNDPDAQAFISAAGITNATQRFAINQLVLDLKSYSLWTKMNAIYPFVGGTVTTHKFNLKDPRDLDVAYRIQFNGGWTHNSNGIQGDGSTAFANTFASINTAAIPNQSNHWSVYQTTSAGSGYNGIYDGNVARMFGFSTGFGKYVGLQNFASAASETTGFYNGTVTSVSNGVLYRNGTNIYSVSNTGSIATLNFYLGALNINGSTTNYSPVRFAFASLGGSLDATNAANLYTAVQAFQTALSRQI